MAEKVAKAEKIANKIATVISGTAFIGMVIFISMNVISRYFFNRSFNWAEEVTYLFFNWAVFFGVTIIYRHNGLTAIDAIVNRLPIKGKRVVMTINFFIILAINVSLIIWGTTFALNAFARKSPTLGIPYFYFDLSIPLACILLAAYTLKFLIRTIKGEDVEEAAIEERL